MRLDKLLAHAGFGTRREVKQLIRKGYVQVNGELCSKDDTRIDEDKDLVHVDGVAVQYTKDIYIMLNKPAGVICASDDAMHDTVFDCIAEPLPAGCFTIGRLDIDTEGLLIITNDGKLSHNLLSPRKHVDKCYYIESEKPLQAEDMQKIEKGIIIDHDEQCLPAVIRETGTCMYELTIHEGKYHQVKRMLEAVDNKVLYLKRIRMGNVLLDTSLKSGEYRWLSEEEIQKLKERN